MKPVDVLIWLFVGLAFYCVWLANEDQKRHPEQRCYECMSQGE
jgi:hypothetical protein